MGKTTSLTKILNLLRAGGPARYPGSNETVTQCIFHTTALMTVIRLKSAGTTLGLSDNGKKEVLFTEIEPLMLV